jgi:type VI secretion system secreted protein Hcp
LPAAPVDRVDLDTDREPIRQRSHGEERAMAGAIFARIAGIKGESVDAKHKDEIDVLSWSWGVSQTGSMAHGGGGGAGKATFADFVFSHHIDKASPLLMKACAIGQHIANATVTQRRAGNAQHEFLVITMTDVLVVSVSNGGSVEGEATSETVALAFAKVDVEYKPQKADGSLDAGSHFKYDLKANKEG